MTIVFNLQDEISNATPNFLMNQSNSAHEFVQLPARPGFDDLPRPPPVVNRREILILRV